MKRWRVYMLRCRDDSIYTGATNDLARRIESHRRGAASRYTRSRLPVALVHDESAADRGAALRREAQIKRLSRDAKLALIRAGRRNVARARRRSTRAEPPRDASAARNRPVRLSQRRARRLIVAAQGLDGGWNLPTGKEGAAVAVERLGYVQIDTIAVVERAHHHTLWSRCPDYEPGMLLELHARDRRVFEYWSPAASVLPMVHYRHSLPRMAEIRAHPRTRRYLKENARVVDGVRRRIRDEGALSSADFEDTSGRRRGPWWDWKPAKRALEMLFSTGELMIAERRNFQRVYDLAERVLPATIDVSEPDAAEQARFVARQMLETRGLAAPRERPMRERPSLERAMAELVEAGAAARVSVDGADDGVFYAATRMLESTATRRTRRPALHILSPFDSLVIDRGRLRRFFEFDCKLEAYTPRAKRVYGYFCLPLLWGEDFIGRIDARADRARRTLVIESLRMERGFAAGDSVLRPLARRLRDFARWNGCDRIRIVRSTPRAIGTALRRELRDRA